MTAKIDLPLVFGSEEKADLDLGSNHWLGFSNYEDEVSGAVIYHYNERGGVCLGWIAFAGRAWAESFNKSGRRIETWKIQQEDPLTLWPSLQCNSCPDHGWIKNGKWEKA